MVMPGEVVQQGDTVVFDVNGERQAFVVVRPKRRGPRCNATQRSGGRGVRVTPAARRRGAWRRIQRGRRRISRALAPPFSPPHSKVKMGNSFFSVEPFVGAPWGAVFTVSADGHSLERTQQ